MAMPGADDTTRTYGTRAAAEKRWQSIQKKVENAVGGFGIVLGQLSDRPLSGRHRSRLCRDANGAVADWAQG